MFPSNPEKCLLLAGRLENVFLIYPYGTLFVYCKRVISLAKLNQE